MMFCCFKSSRPSCSYWWCSFCPTSGRTWGSQCWLPILFGPHVYPDKFPQPLARLRLKLMWIFMVNDMKCFILCPLKPGQTWHFWLHSLKCLKVHTLSRSITSEGKSVYLFWTATFEGGAEKAYHHRQGQEVVIVQMWITEHIFRLTFTPSHTWPIAVESGQKYWFVSGSECYRNGEVLINQYLVMYP